MRTNACAKGLRSSVVGALICLLAVAPSVSAHQQWLAPNFFFAPDDKAWLTFDHTFGDRRFLPASAPGSYYRWWVTGPDGTKRPVPFLFLGRTRTVREVELETAGTYRLEGEERSMAWTLISKDGEEVWQPGTRADFADANVKRSTVFFNKALAYVTLASPDHQALGSSGDPLEIVFDDHPNELEEGKAFQVTVVAAGRPLPGQEVRLYPERGSAHDAASAVCETDSDGRCSFAAATQGRFLLVTSVEGSYPEGAGTDGFVHSVSVLVEISRAAR